MYRAPTRDLRFNINELLRAPAAWAAAPGLSDYSSEVTDTIIAEASKFAEEVLEPLYRSADQTGARWTPEGVIAPPGFKEAYRQYVEGGWGTLRAGTRHGGQGVPNSVGTAVEEMFASANLAFKLGPMLTQGAVEALEHRGTPQQQERYLPKMVTGEWSGTMNLTEPQAGSDLGQIRTRAVPEGDHYRLFGQKIFITYGEHDLADNIIHMVLARIEGAPAGTAGISMFLVPKVLVNPDGSLGERNDVACLSIEHKLGIHGSPTAVMAYGQKDGAIGYLVGEPNQGLKNMFIMMNAARLSVGLEGYAMAERALQQAAEWARTRVQGRPPVAAPGPLPIIHHMDVRRMLMLMKSRTEALRSVALYAAHQLDLAGHHADAARRTACQARGDLLIPVVKAWSTESGIEIASLGIQVHGGMGYIEETGAAQIYRDVRITTIYEGTTGIQANDLIGRKLGRDRGAALGALLDDIDNDLEAIMKGREIDAAIARDAKPYVKALRKAREDLLALLAKDAASAQAVAVPFVRLTGVVLGGWMMAKSAAIAQASLAGAGDDAAFYRAKLQSARFYIDHVMPEALAAAAIVAGGAAAVQQTAVELI
ncbi:MAG: acyl-CoA dehydrogenase [Steroidobacteraceae bacterium]